MFSGEMLRSPRLGLRARVGLSREVGGVDGVAPVNVRRTGNGRLLVLLLIPVECVTAGEGDDAGRGGKDGGKLATARVGEVGGEINTSSLSGRLACLRSRVPKFLT